MFLPPSWGQGVDGSRRKGGWVCRTSKPIRYLANTARHTPSRKVLYCRYLRSISSVVSRHGWVWFTTIPGGQVTRAKSAVCAPIHSLDSMRALPPITSSRLPRRVSDGKPRVAESWAATVKRPQRSSPGSHMPSVRNSAWLPGPSHHRGS